jgi:ParB/RepB/Spo0J family partition protein
MQVDLHRMELRFEGTRIVDAPAVQRLANSIEERGQMVACIAVPGQPEGTMVLIDGYRRVGALRRLGMDTALVQCWQCPVGTALAQMLAHSLSRVFDPMEEALILRELIDQHGLSQREAARQCARDVSWVQRRLTLLGALPQELVQAVRSTRVSSWAAARILAPLARANSEHASRLLRSMDLDRMSTRELQAWFAHYQSSQHKAREHMVEHPRLFIEGVKAVTEERAARKLKRGPEGEVVGDLGYLHALVRRLSGRLSELKVPLEPALLVACKRLHVALPTVAQEIHRLVSS